MEKNEKHQKSSSQNPIKFSAEKYKQKKNGINIIEENIQVRHKLQLPKHQLSDKRRELKNDLNFLKENFQWKQKDIDTYIKELFENGFTNSSQACLDYIFSFRQNNFISTKQYIESNKNTYYNDTFQIEEALMNLKKQNYLEDVEKDADHYKEKQKKQYYKEKKEIEKQKLKKNRIQHYKSSQHKHDQNHIDKQQYDHQQFDYLKNYKVTRNVQIYETQNNNNDSGKYKEDAETNDNNYNKNIYIHNNHKKNMKSKRKSHFEERRKNNSKNKIFDQQQKSRKQSLEKGGFVSDEQEQNNNNNGGCYTKQQGFYEQEFNSNKQQQLLHNNNNKNKSNNCVPSVQAHFHKNKELSTKSSYNDNFNEQQLSEGEVLPNKKQVIEIISD